jgi:serine/threonine-protein kinase
MPHNLGDLLGGRYRLDDRIASGGMGEVWRATDTVLRRTVAIKTLHADRAVDPQFRSRFQHEARAMAALHHSGIADVYDFGQEAGNDAYLVMAYVSGQSLDRRIAERGRLGAAETMSIVAQAGHALQAAHDAGIVHRDVKPGNIIREPSGTVVLVDFGVARSAQSAALTGAQEVVGTAHYLAPEQVSKQPVGPATDVYALGAVAYACLAGHPPFLGPSPVAVAAQHLSEPPPPLPGDVPPPARALVATALAKDPAARFPSAGAMAAAAETAELSVLRTGSVPVPSGSPAGRPRRRHTATVVLVALLLLLGAGTALAIADPFGAPPRPPGSSTPAPTGTAATSPRSTAPAPSGNGAGQATPSTPTSTRTTRSPSPAPSAPSTRPTTTSQTPARTPTGPASPPLVSPTAQGGN